MHLATPRHSELLNTVICDFYSFNTSNKGFIPRSVVVVAVPKPVVQIGFQWERIEYEAYTDGWSGGAVTASNVEAFLLKYFHRMGQQIVRFDALPQKQLAVRCGLAEYGRNNLTYAKGMGCFHQIMTFITEMSCAFDSSMELRRMNACESCNACIKACPTQAITGSHNMIDAERCLTYFNEFIDLAPFPEWIPVSAHHSFHGCLRCQLNCPQNVRYVKTVEPAIFSEADVTLLLEGLQPCDLPVDLAEKIRILDLDDYLPLLPRNIMAIVQAQNA